MAKRKKKIKWKYQLSEAPCDIPARPKVGDPIPNPCPSCGEKLLMIDDRVVAHATCMCCGDQFCVRRYL